MGKHRRKVKRGLYEVSLVKSQCVALPDRRVMFFMLINKTGKAGEREGFVRTLMRMGTVKSFMDLADSVVEKGPAKNLRMGDFGYDEDWLMYMENKHALRSDFRKLIHNRFKKALSYRDFLIRQTHESKRQNGYERGKYYDYSSEFGGLRISDYTRFEENKWYEFSRPTLVKGRKIRKPKVIQ